MVYLPCHEVRVDPAGLHEVVVGPLLNQPSLVHHRNVIRVHPVSYTHLTLPTIYSV